MTTAPGSPPTVPRHRSAPLRLGWWHSFWRQVLLFGHERPGLQPLSGDVPDPVRELALLIEDRRSEFANVARLRGADYKGGYWMMYLVAPLAVFCGALASADSGHSGILSGIEFLLIVSILLLFIAMRRGHWQEQWIRARRTAEHLRYLPLVAPFVQDPAGNWYEDVAAHHGVQIIIDEEVTRVCKVLERGNATHALRLDNALFRAEYLRYVDELLTQQIGYHSANADIEHALSHRISLASNAFFGITIICAALLFLESFATSLGIGDYLRPRVLRLLATVLPAVGAGLRGLLAQGESHRVAAISDGMALRLGQLRAQLRALAPGPESKDALESLIWNAVQELLSEADTWMRLQESVPLSVTG